MSIRRNILALLFASAAVSSLESCGDSNEEGNNGPTINSDSMVVQVPMAIRKKTFYKVSSTEVGVEAVGELDADFLRSGSHKPGEAGMGMRRTVYRTDSFQVTVRQPTYYRAYGDGSYVPYKDWNTDQKFEFADAMHFLNSKDKATGPTSSNPTIELKY